MMLRQLVRLVCLAAVIPLLAFVSAWGMQRYALANPDLVAGGSVGWRMPATLEEIAAAGQLVDRLNLLMAAAAIFIALSLALLLTQISAALVASRRQAWLAVIFPGAVRLTVWAMVVLSIAQAGLVAATVWLAEATFLAGFHTTLFLFLVVSLLAVAGLVLRGGAGAMRPFVLDAVAQPLDHERHRDMIARVHGIARKLGARPSDAIIAGLEPTFYATSCDIRLSDGGRTLSGETLHISLPHLGLLSHEEFDAIVGHELGHFRGEDTAYSRKFVPIQARLLGAMGALVDRGGYVQLPAIPTLLGLAFLHELFELARARLDRERELRADEAAVEAAGRGPAASALLKIEIYEPVIEAAMSECLTIGEGGFVAGIVTRAHDHLQPETWTEELAAALRQTAIHPTDSHPPTAARLQAIQVSAEDITQKMLGPPSGDSAASLIPDIEQFCAAQIAWLKDDISQSALTMVSPILGALSDGFGDPAAGFSRG